MTVLCKNVYFTQNIAFYTRAIEFGAKYKTLFKVKCKVLYKTHSQNSHKVMKSEKLTQNSYLEEREQPLKLFILTCEGENE